LTGYVPETAQSAFVGKANFGASDHWLAYSMPRATTLEELGLRDAVTPWNDDNLVRILPLGTPVWKIYKYDGTGGYWYDIWDTGVPVNPSVACGQAYCLIRRGLPDTGDYLTMPTWYANPPNDW